jgi:hypothetical protein
VKTLTDLTPAAQALLDRYQDPEGRGGEAMRAALLKVEAEARASAEAQIADLIEAGEALWGVVANASNGNWSEQSAEWQAAAARWRDNWERARLAAPPTEPVR